MTHRTAEQKHEARSRVLLRLPDYEPAVRLDTQPADRELVVHTPPEKIQQVLRSSAEYLDIELPDVIPPASAPPPPEAKTAAVMIYERIRGVIRI